MIMSRQASRRGGDSGTVAPDASGHELFTAGGQAREPAEHRPPAAARPDPCRQYAHIAAVPATAGSLTAGHGQPTWKDPRDDSRDLHHRAG